MAKVVKVTSAQVKAARLKVARSSKTGKTVSPSVSAIANARRVTSGSITSNSGSTGRE